MDKRTSQVSGCDALNNSIVQEVQCDVQMLPPTMKECGYKSLKSPNYHNYYDGLFCESIKLKKELPEDECPQSATAAPCTNKSGIYSNIVFENEELSKVPEKQTIKEEVLEEALIFIKTEEIHDENDKFIAKTEMSEEYRILSNAGDTSVLYKVQTNQEIQPTMCGGILKNGFNLLTHNNEHIKIEPTTLVGNEENELHKCQYCDEYFNHHNMLTHMEDVHSHKKHKSEILYHKSTKKIDAGNNVDGINNKCDFCRRIYKNKSALVSHLQKIHYNYGRIFACWCGKQFLTPRHLYKHKSRQHAANIKNTNDAALKKEFQCDDCKKMFKSKITLKKHILYIHYDYGRKFECWCGKQFRTPIHLCKHKSRQHAANIKSKNDAALKKEFQCDDCKKMFKSKIHLKKHILYIHYDYGRKFECCGKQFRTPIHLNHHKNKQHGVNGKRTNDTALKKEFQCNVCNSILKSEKGLKRHITSIHYAYGETFKCWCGKQFPTPIYLYQHKNKQHGADGKRLNDTALQKEFQCDICKKIFKCKDYIKIHILNIHYDYDKTFKCWCGKQFRTPKYLYQHKIKQHSAHINTTNDAALKKVFQCDVCKKRFKSKYHLKQHILNIHYDYDKAFECWCGKQFRTPVYLYQHKNRQHGANIKMTNDAALKKVFQCDVCKKMFEYKHQLKKHILSIHYNYGRKFKCWCGKQFRTPIHLYQHKYNQHGANVKSTNNARLKKVFECYVCKKILKCKSNLKQHILSIHCDYGKTFKCWCGKEFRTPIHLNNHKWKQHRSNIKKQMMQH